jgi:hypothetical protein
MPYSFLGKCNGAQPAAPIVAPTGGGFKRGIGRWILDH